MQVTQRPQQIHRPSLPHRREARRKEVHQKQQKRHQNLKRRNPARQIIQNIPK